MLIKQSSYILSFLIHILLFMVILYWFSSVNDVLPPVKEVPLIALTFKKAVKESRIVESSALSPITSSVPIPRESVKENITSPLQTAEVPSFDTSPIEELEKEAAIEDRKPELSGEIIYSREEPILLDSEPLLLVDDIPLDSLLIQEGKKEKQISQELYTIEFQNNDKRKILNYPNILLDYTDPALSTLTNCKISFIITREGLVDDIKMIEPGTGSPTYNGIIEDLMVQLLFEPGRQDRGIIFINFELISGNKND